MAACVLLPLAAAQVKDIKGNDYKLSGATDAKVTIVYFVTNDCPRSEGSARITRSPEHAA